MHTCAIHIQRRQWHPTQEFLPGKSHGRRSLVGCSPWGQAGLSNFTFTFHFHALEKEMATHLCSCLENPTGGGAWWAAFSGVAQSRTRLKRLSSSSRGTNGQAFLIRALPILPSLFCEVLPITCCARFLNTRCFPVLSPLLFLWSPAYFTF